MYDFFDSLKFGSEFFSLFFVVCFIIQLMNCHIHAAPKWFVNELVGKVSDENKQMCNDFHTCCILVNTFEGSTV